MRLAAASVWAAVLSAVVAGGAAAQKDSAARDYTRTGFYIGLAETYAVENFDDRSGGMAFSGENEFGFYGRLGWRFAERGAVEVTAEWVPFEARKGGANADFDSVATTVNLKWLLPLGRVEPFALFGLGALVIADPSSEPSAFAWRGGLGLQVHFTQHISGVLEGSYLGPTEALSEIPYGSIALGLQYRF